MVLTLCLTFMDELIIERINFIHYLLALFTDAVSNCFKFTENGAFGKLLPGGKYSETGIFWLVLFLLANVASRLRLYH